MSRPVETGAVSRRATGENHIRRHGAAVAVTNAMRCVALMLLFVVGCAEHGSGGEPPDPNRPPPPTACEGHCISDRPVVTSTDCCDSVTCFFDETADEWIVTFCDVHPDDPCDLCAPGELCVQGYDGACNQATTCAPITAVCPENACSPECEAAYCNAPLQCQNRTPCGTESPKAFTCYGP